MLLTICLSASCRTRPLDSAPDLLSPPEGDLATPPPADLAAPQEGDLARSCPALSLIGACHVTAPAETALVPSSSLTVEAWVYMTSLRAGLIAGVIDLALGYGPWWFGVFDGGGLGFVINGPNGGDELATSQGLTPARWSHVAAVFDTASSTIALYLDGHQIAHGTATIPALRMLVAPLWVGYSTAPMSFALNGWLAELRISAGSRYTQDFVPEHTFTNDPYTVALYHFDESSGAVAHDASIYRNDAALVDGATFASPPVCR